MSEDGVTEILTNINKLSELNNDNFEELNRDDK